MKLTTEQELEPERLLSDIRFKAEQLMASDEEAHNAGVSDEPLPSFGDVWEGWLEYEEEISGKSAWEETKVLAWQERKQFVMERRKRHFQTVLSHYLINEWIKEKALIKDGTETGIIRRTVDNLLRDDRSQEAELYLRDVLVSGRRFADKEIKRRRIGGWAWFGYSFIALRGLIYVAAVLAVFTVAQSRFEKVSMAVLVIIGNMLLTNREGNTLYRLRFGTAVDNYFNALRRVLKVPEDESERRTRSQARFEADKSLARGIINTNIAFLFEAIVWLICVAELILTIW